MIDRASSFKRQLRQFRILTVVGYVLLLLVISGMVMADVMFSHVDMSVPVQLPIALVGLVLVIAVCMPFLMIAYDKTICPHCGKRIEDGHWYWHGIRCNGPTRRYWKLFSEDRCNVRIARRRLSGTGRPEVAPYRSVLW